MADSLARLFLVVVLLPACGNGAGFQALRLRLDVIEAQPGSDFVVTLEDADCASNARLQLEANGVLLSTASNAPLTPETCNVWYSNGLMRLENGPMNLVLTAGDSSYTASYRFAANRMLLINAMPGVELQLPSQVRGSYDPRDLPSVFVGFRYASDNAMDVLKVGPVINGAWEVLLPAGQRKGEGTFDRMGLPHTRWVYAVRLRVLQRESRTVASRRRGGGRDDSLRRDLTDVVLGGLEDG